MTRSPWPLASEGKALVLTGPAGVEGNFVDV